MADISHSFRSEGKYTDLILSHKGGSFKVHKIIVCAISTFFDKACSNWLRVSASLDIAFPADQLVQELQEGVIEMTEMTFLELGLLFSFFYSLKYDDNIVNPIDLYTGSTTCPLQLSARMFALGDRFDVPILRMVAIKKYYSKGNRMESLQILQSVSNVYQSNPTSVRELRNAICALAQEHLPRFFYLEAFEIELGRVTIACHEFAKDLLTILLNDKSKLDR